MSSNPRCPGLMNSNYLHDNSSDIAPLRVVVLNGCYLTQVYYFNIIMSAMKGPFVLTYANHYVGWNDSIWSELYYNRSDFSPNIAELNYYWYRTIQYSPLFFFGNAITILSGKILADNGNRFSITSSFSLEIWLLFCALLILVAICKQILHKKYSKWTSYLVNVIGNIN